MSSIDAAYPTQGISNTSAHHATRSSIAAKAGACSSGVRLSEHHIVGVFLGGGHGVMPAGQPAHAGNAFGLELIEGFVERCDAGHMRAVSTGSRDQIGTTIEQKSCVFILHRCRQCFGAIYQSSFVSISQAQTDSGDIAGLHGRG